MKLLLSITMCLKPRDGCEACLWGTREHSGRACALISCPFSWDRPVQKFLPVSTSQFTSSKLAKTGSYSVKESQPHTQLVNRKQGPREWLGKVTEARGWHSGARCIDNSKKENFMDRWEKALNFSRIINAQTSIFIVHHCSLCYWNE